jgi:hypothetical protein
MVKMDHQNGPQIEIAKMKYSAFKSTPFETLNEPNIKIYIIVFTLPFFGWLPNKSTQCSQIFDFHHEGAILATNCCFFLKDWALNLLCPIGTFLIE